ncbi:MULTISPECIES: bifunctional phosphopantothenoylcysteine decarboxylase/phosphopantothenate--cysteine ligase CoaBC [unclassified Gemella]|uniref:bifunctional phosphopantothenoylcysteine decarboxylase/phosphopantothenate--cysteine ligase CoaBC n=1 Tax=unclassified Gemella TaxID=2624949 RepID=UPI001C046CF0|nr:MULTISPECIES: bifunctional phosphopantothenoylcysteine decarboxylase/phosphopantothenate--cysteine ligase CoaBC [unclassified Gemella]MBU0278289.1 bifunctional phosphopantothenoylcysteine decarboxylase/phosphopantothenate--cysteine ligase CoaBC [Gemella sp. zg-1178]QWQ38205.1 bifunctional phosphopantothenoylcysteine decarboxylase/phosphopantothenate--cysteine ligase CoaBC [Gemella sp. zg-570]
MNILHIVSGGIAAYKSLDLVSKLTKSGHNVKIVMTENAAKFVTELSFQTISKNFVYTDTFIEKNEKEIQHIDLNKWADKIIIAPATANIIAKIASGIADDLASTLILAVNDFSKIYIAPAMNTNMYNNPITQGNIFKLQQLGFNFIEPASGILACGDEGKGKLSDTDTIINSVLVEKKFSNKTILVTAGATKEYIDPVRFISNPSSGKMGIAIAEEFANQGAKVYLITATDYSPINSNIEVISIVTAYDMFEEIKKYYEECDIVVKAAAVSDYTPVIKYDRKVKKQLGNIEIELERTDDILYYLGQNKKDNQILVGFAAETDNVIDYAKEKIKKKNLDFIVANDVSKKDIGFASDNNEVAIIDKYDNIYKINKTSKTNIAKSLISKLID